MILLVAGTVCIKIRVGYGEVQHCCGVGFGLLRNGESHASPSPEKPAFVKVGDAVNAGDVVCIIESMKLMNEINSEFSGKVAEIYAKDGQAVEYGQKLMRIE